MLDERIAYIEDLSLNAWPSHKMELYDGWILRFSYFYTHRTNSVEQIGACTLPWNIKIPYCEREYARLGSPALFKISPLVDPNFDYLLENRGYEVQHETLVMTMDLSGTYYPPQPLVALSEDIPLEWIHGLFTLKQMESKIHWKVVPSMYAAIPKDTICARIYEGEEIVATGLGILDRDYIGIYAIHVRDDCRRRGYARSICESLLRSGKKKGAASAYLQVVKGNESAKRLYSSLGFEELYSYYFRVQNAPAAPFTRPA